MGVRHSVPVDRGDVGIRIDRVLQRHFSRMRGVTRNRLQHLIAGGYVQINGRPVTRASTRVAAADTIEIELPERRPRAAPLPENIPLDIRYEDDDLLVVNKPPGQVAHPAFRNVSGTLLNALLAHAGGHWTPALVTRLDKGTSGLVLVAKSAGMHAALQRLSHANDIIKEYLAIVAGRPPARGTIDLALDRDPWDRRRVTVRDRGGVPSVTRFERLRVAATRPETHVSLVRCRLLTGRMHQLRVHLAAKGWPIVGDTTYGPRGSAVIGRQALHAWRVAFTHPTSGARIDVTAAPPDDMAGLMALFGAGEAG